MPAKWKIFFVLNLILLLPALVCLCLIVANLFNDRYQYRREDELFIFLAIAAFSTAMIVVNSLVNIYLLQRFFPDKMMTSGVKTMNGISLVTNILVSIALLIFCSYGASFELRDYSESNDNTGLIALSFTFVYWLLQVIVLVMQVQLPGLINRNNKEKMDSLIDSIGK